MALNLEDKKQIVADIAAVAESARSIIASDYRGLTVAEMSNLRVRAREQEVSLHVVKNTLARRALDGTKYQCLCDQLSGPLVFAFSREDPTAAARLLKGFLAEHDQVEVKLIAVEGELLEVSAFNRLADLPTKDESIALLMGVVQMPLVRLVATLSAVSEKLVRVLVAIQQQKQNTTA